MKETNNQNTMKSNTNKYFEHDPSMPIAFCFKNVHQTIRLELQKGKTKWATVSKNSISLV